jgi:hypothetical protein
LAEEGEINHCLYPFIRIREAQLSSLWKGTVGRDAIEQALRPLKDDWSERKTKIAEYEQRSKK